MAKKKVSGVGAILGYQSRADMAVAEAIEAGEKVALSPLFSILPDPDQPWDLLPDHLYDRLYEGESPPTVMQSWLSLAKAGEASPAHERAVASLEQLAPTIAQHDLIQPIVICGADKIDIMLPEGVIYVMLLENGAGGPMSGFILKINRLKGGRLTTFARSPLRPAAIFAPCS